MTQSLLINLIIFIGLIGVCFFFSSAETAFTAISRIKLRHLLDKKVKGSKKLHFILHYPKRLLTAILIGNNLAQTSASAMAAVVMTNALRYSGIENMAVVLGIITGVLAMILLTFGEIFPKTIAMKNPTRLALAITPVMFYVMFVLYPVISLFVFISNMFSRFLGLPHHEEDKILTEDEIRTVIKLAEEDGILEKEEKKMLEGVFNVTEKVVREIMTPRTDAICIEADSTAGDVIALISETGHSRIPVYENEIDNIIGIIYAKDLLRIESPDENCKKFLRTAVFIPESKYIEDLMQHMKFAKFHMAIVVDEHGGMSGLVTFEDIIEEIVGEIQDEFEREEQPVTQLDDETFVIDASVNIDDLPQNIREILPQEDTDYDTIGGFVLSELGTIPKQGKRFAYKNLEITIQDVKKRRIVSLTIKILEPSDSD